MWNKLKQWLHPDHITRGSIKEGFDDLPAAVCYFTPDGIIRLCNRQMFRVYRALSGRDLQSLEELHQQVWAPTHGRRVDGKNPSFVLPDGTCWLYSEQTVFGEGVRPHVECIFSEVTDLQRQRQELLRQNQDKSDRYLFAFGTVLGGVYEYVCSAVTELLFGTVFWDYSKFKFNLGGRINLLYCFFWGIAAVLWMRYGYPLVLKLMKKVRSHIRPWMTAALAVFMAVNMLTSALALARYDARTSGEAPNGQLEVFLDEHFDNARMERIYPNAKKVIKAE